MMSDEVGKHLVCKHEISTNKDTWLFIVNSLVVGGSEKKTVMVANNLSARGYDVHLIYLKGPDNLKHQVNGQVKLTNLGRKSRVDWRAIRKLRTYIKVNNITKIWSVNLFSMLYGYMATTNLRNNIQIVVSINTTHFSEFKDVLQMILYAPVISRMDRIIFGCDMQMRHWLRSYRLSENKSSVIYNGIDINYYQENMLEYSRVDVRNRYGIEKCDVVFGMVARLRPEKDHVCAIKSLKCLIDKGYKVKLLLAGDGRERKSLESLVKNKNLQNDVLFLGDIRDVREVLIAVDVFLLTSISETFSNAALEAMSMSKPVVLSDVGGASEMVDIGKNGYLFESGNVRELTDVLIKMINTELREEMAQYTRHKVCKDFSFKRMVDDYINV